MHRLFELSAAELSALERMYDGPIPAREIDAMLSRRRPVPPALPGRAPGKGEKR